MHNYARIIGLDIGTKRVGLAQSDLLQTIANPVGTFSQDEVLNQIKLIGKEYPIEKFVVGWPLQTDGTEGKAVNMVKSFINRLRKIYPNIPIVKVDERYTSNMANELMLQIGVPKKKRKEKGRVDRIAAALILQQYLDVNK